MMGRSASVMGRSALSLQVEPIGQAVGMRVGTAPLSKAELEPVNLDQGSVLIREIGSNAVQILQQRSTQEAFIWTVSRSMLSGAR